MSDGRRYGELVPDLRTAYDRGAERRDRVVKQPWKVAERAAFLDRLVHEGSQRLLEIGAGTGQDSAFFAQSGLMVVATDLSPAMVDKCREKALDARVLGFTQLASAFPPDSFDAVWSMNCLLHVPTADLQPVIAQIAAVLRSGGLFYLGTWGGDGTEGPLSDDSHDPPRFFSLRTMAQLETAAADAFAIVDARTTVPDGGDWSFHALTLRRR